MAGEAAAAATAAARAEAVNCAKTQRAELAGAVAKLRDELQQEAVVPAATRGDQLQASIEALGADLGRAGAASEAGLQSLREALEEKQGSHHEDLLGQLKQAVANQERVAADVAALSGDVRDLRGVASSLESVFSCSAHWHIHGFQHLFRQLLQQQECVIRSPELSLCALPKLALEIRMAGRGSDDPSRALPLPGAVAVRLWAQPGLRLTFRLTLGEGRLTVSRVFEHTFEKEAEPDGRAFLDISNMCQLGQVWDRGEDTLAVKLELLSFSRASATGAAASQAPLPRRRVLPESDEDPGRTPMLGGYAAVGAQEAKGTDELERVAQAAEAEPYVETDHVIYDASWSSASQLQDKVAGEIGAVRNRSVRRIEWRLEGCADMLNMCRAGQSIDSPIFQAAGLERLQFHFYPRGNDDAEGGAQQCALYVSGPTETMLRGALSVGSITRQLEHCFQKRGDTGGRPRFCTLESQIDCEDSVMIALEVAEVEVNMPHPSTRLCLREARGGDSRPGTTGAAIGPNAKGLLRMRREDPCKTEEFVKCMSLPTLQSRHLHRPLVGRGRRS